MLSLFYCLVTILISSQADFDRLKQDIHRELQHQPAELKVVFAPGTYYFKDNHLYLFEENCPATRLSLEGNGATLIGSAPGIVETPFYRADWMVEVVDADQKLCRIRTRKRLDGQGQLYVQVTSWFRLFTGTVTEMKGRWLYFTIEDLQHSNLVYIVNGNMVFGKQRPRFRLVRMKESGKPISIPVFNFTACTFRQVDVSGITFVCNAGLWVKNPNNFLIRFYSCKLDGASIRECTFKSIRSDVIRIAYTDGGGSQELSVRGLSPNWRLGI